MNKIPEWHRQAVAQLQWWHLYAWLAGVAGALAFVYVLHLFGVGFTLSSMVLILPLTLASSFIIPAAYRRGLEDGRKHPSDSE